MIKLVGFDLDNTLWAVDPIIRRAESELQTWLEQNHPGFSSHYSQSDIVSLRQKFLDKNPAYRHNLTLLRLDLMQELFQTFGMDEAQAKEQSRASFDVFHHWRCKVDLFDGAEALLQKLKGQVKVAAISNGNSDLKIAGLSHLFDAHYRAEDVGAAKPAPDMFQRALNDFAIQPEEFLYIGDHAKEDIHAAHALGIKTIWANMLKKDWPEKYEPVHIDSFTSYSKLDAILESELSA